MYFVEKYNIIKNIIFVKGILYWASYEAKEDKAAKYVHIL
jgi:hypothetical protein